MVKVKLFDKKVRDEFFKYASGITGAITAYVLFWDIPDEYKTLAGIICILLLLGIYAFVWRRANKLTSIDLTVDGTTVTIKAGDIFSQPGLKAIAFNEYFDTQVDEKIIASRSLNGIFINKHLNRDLAELDEHIANYRFEREDMIGVNEERVSGKKQRYQLGTICVWQDYLLTAFARFSEHNEARLTMAEYLTFLINFWDRVNRVYAMESVSVPIFGSGITRIKEHRGISDEELLKIMLWTFRVSEMRFSYPAKLTIVIHQDKIDKINLFELQSSKNGL
ncbi:macro domain-containing protein [Erwinia sp. S38]|uniref:macro domain-containing protein n=1 Tax=Erwinia sp. S38 TaxID=2769338 RepID=UPI00190A5B47|nr:macro domain-containing protein [Erwinia sp. S38]MBK0004530.1 hypothetical protein [Erwinia sp. S38]